MNQPINTILCLICNYEYSKKYSCVFCKKCMYNYNLENFDHELKINKGNLNKQQTIKTKKNKYILLQELLHLSSFEMHILLI